jgi:tRNA (Thr-GGU) A37 N-methylase
MYQNKIMGQRRFFDLAGKGISEIKTAPYTTKTLMGLYQVSFVIALRVLHQYMSSQGMLRRQDMQQLEFRKESRHYPFFEEEPDSGFFALAGKGQSAF